MKTIIVMSMAPSTSLRRADLPGSADRPISVPEHAARQRDASRRLARQQRDGDLCGEIRRVFEANFGVYGVRKVWSQLKREGIDVARCTVARLMKAMGLKGVARGKTVKTTISDKAKVEKWVGMNIDIDDRKRSEAEVLRLQDQIAQAQIREGEERLRLFGEASHDVLWIRDAENFQWTYLTPAFETIYGLRRDEALLGDNYRSWLGLVVMEDRERADDNIRRVRAGERATFEYRIRRPVDGEIHGSGALIFRSSTPPAR